MATAGHRHSRCAWCTHLAHGLSERSTAPQGSSGHDLIPLKAAEDPEAAAVVSPGVGEGVEAEQFEDKGNSPRAWPQETLLQITAKCNS